MKDEATERKAGSFKLAKYYVSGNLYLKRMHLTSLEGCPKIITGNFSCADNDLVSLEGGPEEVHGNFECEFNKISSFEHFPTCIGGDCYIGFNQFTSFKDIDKYVKFIGNAIIDVQLTTYEMNHKITSGYSDLFGIDGLQEIGINSKQIGDIVNKYIRQKDLINFQDEMIKSGYESYL